MTACRAISASSLVAGIMRKSSELETFGRREGLEPVADGNASDRAFYHRAQQRFDLAGVEVDQHGLDRSDRGGGEREQSIAQTDERQRSDRFRPQLAA